MTAGKYYNRDVVITEPNTTIIEAAKLMRKHHVGDLVVVKKTGRRKHPRRNRNGSRPRRRSARARDPT